MATDYDAPRVREGEEAGDKDSSIEELRGNARERQSPKMDETDETEAESFELPGADLSHELLEVEVKPLQEGELQCSRCYLLHARSVMVSIDPPICRDCD